MKGIMVEDGHERNVKAIYSIGSRCGMYVKKGADSDYGDWVRSKGTKYVGNVRCGVVEFSGGVRG